MRKSLFLYLFIISVLLNIFTYVYFSKQVKFDQSQNKGLATKYQDTLTQVRSQLMDAGYFSLENNQNAQNYLERSNRGKIIMYEKLIPVLKEKLVEFNDEPKGNPYTGQDQIGPQKFIINKIQVLNHRWIIADYSDGEYWGEVLLKYFINDDETLQFEVIQSILYQK